MSHNNQSPSMNELMDRANYDIGDLESEIRADQHAKALLKEFHQWLLHNKGYEDLKAGQYAAGADYYLREFLVGALRLNIFSTSSRHLQQFGGNWYIINNLEPNLQELEPMLKGAADFYRYCAEIGLVQPVLSEEMDELNTNLDFYAQRIEDFHQLEDDGYRAWIQACPVK